MTKNKKIALFMFAILGILFFTRKETMQSNSELKNYVSTNVKDTPIPKRQYIDQKMDPMKRAPASVGYVNSPSPDWEKKLETTLRAQGGNSLKEIKIKKEKSLVWMRDENPLYVESVIVTLTNQQEMESSFRALVDSQTGKVLESWDRTIFDPANIKDDFRIKLDSRYTN